MPAKLRTVSALLIFAPFAFLIMINVHEIGHTLLARALGDGDAVYYLYKQFDADKACFGCNIYDARKLSELGNLLVSLGGVLASQLVVFALVWVWRRRAWVREPRYLIVTAIILFASDVPFQVFRGIQADIASQAGLVRVDLADFLYLLHRMFAIPLDVGKIGLLVVAVLYCLLVFRSVRRQWRRPRTASAPDLDAAGAG